MKATLIIFKSGASVTVYHKEDNALDWDAVNVLNRDNIDLELDVTENTKNEAKWLIEHRQHIKEKLVNADKVQVDAQVEAHHYLNHVAQAEQPQPSKLVKAEFKP